MAYKLEILVIDRDNIGRDAIVDEIRNANYGNDCISPHVMNMQSADIGVWTDDHPLNKHETWKEEYLRLFPQWKQASKNSSKQTLSEFLATKWELPDGEVNNIQEEFIRGGLDAVKAFLSNCDSNYFLKVKENILEYMNVYK